MELATDRHMAMEIRRLHRLEKRALAHRERGRLSGNQAVMRRAIKLELAVHERLNALNQGDGAPVGVAL